MTTNEAIELFIADGWTSGQITSVRTERTYRSILGKHSEDVDNRSPHAIGRDDVKRTLARWRNPNTQRVGRSIMMSYYRWTVEEGIRPANPVEQTKRPKKRPTSVYRMTLEETAAFLAAAEGVIEWRATRLGVCAGLRSAELRGLQGRHFRRPGFIWVSADIAKGAKERWVPVLPQLAAVWEDINHNVADDEYVLPAQRARNPGVNTVRMSLSKKQMSPQGLYYLVGRVGKRAGIQARIHPHLMRHAFGDHIARQAGLLIAQAMLGHSDVSTTRESYVGRVTLDELKAASENILFDTNLLPPVGRAAMASEAPTGIEPVDTASGTGARDLGRLLVALRESFA